MVTLDKKLHTKFRISKKKKQKKKKKHNHKPINSNKFFLKIKYILRNKLRKFCSEKIATIYSYFRKWGVYFVIFANLGVR
jgi:hypothetical protein